MEAVVENDFSIVELRMIQSLWQTKAPEHIAWLLDKPFAMVERKIKEMNQVHKVKLHERPSFTKKILPKKVDQELLEDKKIKIKDTTGTITVRIDAKTVVQVKPGTDIEKLKEKFRQNRLLK